MGRLTSESNNGVSSTYTYDSNNNLTSKTKSGVTTSYAIYYNKLYYYQENGTTYNFSYDALGNPTIYKNSTMTWSQGNKLSYTNLNSNNSYYYYDSQGIRYKKIVNNEVTEYYLNGTQILAENRINHGGMIYYIYDTDGLVGFVYNNNYYYYDKNILGDILYIRDTSRIIVASYTYDAYGNILSSSGTLASVNPFRYRGYYYDIETGFYYLNARYYDPSIYRFVNADSTNYVGPNDTNGFNLYAYCSNDPINLVDPTGHSFLSLLIVSIVLSSIICGTLNGVSSYCSGERGLDLYADILGGMIFGAAVGASLALGGAAGLAATGVMVSGFGLSSSLALGLSVSITSFAAMAQYSLDCFSSYDNNWEVTGLISSGIEGAFQGATTFMFAYIGGKSGLYNKLGNFSTNDVFYVRYGGTNTLRAIVWSSKVLVGESLSRVVFISIPSALTRKFIDWLIPDSF